jgi:hypothetical protein
MRSLKGKKQREEQREDMGTWERIKCGKIKKIRSIEKRSKEEYEREKEESKEK